MIRRTCIICKTNFEIDGWEAKNRAGKYCNRTCMGKGRKTGEYRNCLECKTIFYVIPAQLKRRKTNGSYCRKSCMYKSPIRNKKLTGENNYNWKGGGKNLERTKFRDRLQKKIFERDNYTCQVCEVRGVELHIDHIKPWAEYIELRFSMENCRTLCVPCHYHVTFKKPMPKDTKKWGHSYLKL